MANVTINQLEGGAALCDWFEGTPSFHDATLRELELRQGSPSRMVAHTFRMDSKTNSKGYFKLTKHVVVTFTIFNLVEVELQEFKEAGIMNGLDIENDNEGVTLSFGSSYGVHGRIKAKRVVVSFEARKPEEGDLASVQKS
jgi:hypothetical protein